MYLVIDLGDEWIQLVEGSYTAAGFQVKNALEIQVTEGSFDDDGCIKYHTVSKLIQEALQSHEIHAKEVLLTIQSEYLINKTFKIPQVKPKELPSVLRQEMMLLLETDIEYILYHGQPVEEKGAMYVNVSALPKKIVEGAIELVKEFKGQLKGFYTHEYAMTKYIEMQKNAKTFMIADIGSQRMQLYLFEKGTNVYRQNIQINTKQHEMTFSSLNELQGVKQDFKDVNLLKEHFNVQPIAEETLTTYLNDLASQLQNMSLFQLNRNAQAPVEKIYLCGGVAHIEGLCEYLENELGVSVKLLSDWLFQDTKLPNGPLSFVNALNLLAVSGAKEHDFIKGYKDYQKAHQKIHLRTLVGMGILGTQLALMALFGMTQLWEHITLKREITKINAVLNDESLNQQIEQVRTKQNKQYQMQQTLVALEAVKTDIKQHPVLDLAFFKTLELGKPQDVIIEATAYEEGVLHLYCHSTSKESIVQYVSYLRKLPIATNTIYSGFNLENGQYLFQVDMALEGGSKDEA